MTSGSDSRDVIVKPGDFCCVPVSGQAGKLIGLGEWLNGSAFTAYQHAEVYLGSEEMMVEAAGKEVVAKAIAQLGSHNAQYGYTFSAYPGGAKLVPMQVSPVILPGSLWSSGAFSITYGQGNAVIRAALSYLGTGYGWLDYAALAAHRLHVPAPHLKAFIESSHTMICSQLVDRAYLDAGIHLFDDGRWPGYVTPADLADLIHCRLELAA